MSEALTIVGAFANIIVAITAGLALYLAWRQISMSRELSALEAYENYHMMCLSYPDFSTGNIPFESFDESKRRCYEIYVLYTLMMAERIYALFPNDPGWAFSIKDDIRLHKEFIASAQFAGQRANQGWIIAPVIDAVLEEHGLLDVANQHALNLANQKAK